MKVDERPGRLLKCTNVFFLFMNNRLRKKIGRIETVADKTTHRRDHFIVSGKDNLIDQRNKQGEYSNYPQEELLEFIKAKMPKDAVFGGSMPTMATVKLGEFVAREN